jgi:hypothetical protein
MARGLVNYSLEVEGIHEILRRVELGVGVLPQG